MTGASIVGMAAHVIVAALAAVMAVAGTGCVVLWREWNREKRSGGSGLGVLAWGFYALALGLAGLLGAL